MSLGSFIGPYEIASPLGAGGMGEVYRAVDTRLKRQVAIKVLPASVAGDEERLRRFQREAEVLAQLNHPNIAAIYGLEDTPGVKALVMELVEGPTLADRIAEGPIPVDEALPIARQIAEALEAAHEQGIIHRDLKPANVKVRSDGTVKVLDFGLARALEPAGSALSSGLSQLPTITTPTMTRAGTILGTAAYMSPEQAKGKPADKRSDIWAFGATLYEMLTGRRAFPGEDLAETLGAVIHKEPAWEALPAALSPVLQSVLRRCLHKQPTQRVRDAGDLRLAIDGAFEPVATSTPPARSPSVVRWAAAGGILAVVAAAAIGWSLRPTETRPVSRFMHVLPDDQSPVPLGQSLVAVAPDGSSIVYATGGQLFRRAIGDLTAAPIQGTSGSPRAPFFSPEGDRIGYWDGVAEELRTVPVGGGTPTPLASASTLYGASWAADGMVWYGQRDGIWRVPAAEGAPELIVRIEPDELVFGPRLLPDGNTLLFSLAAIGSMEGQSTAWDQAEIVTQVLASGERVVVGRGGDPRYVPTGHLVYALDTVLYAVPFDAGRLKVGGRPLAIVDGVQRAVRGSQGQAGSANYDVSASGTLVYWPAGTEPADTRRRLLAVDRDGEAESLPVEERDYWRPSISPDGARIAVQVVIRPGGDSQVWVVDISGGTATPLCDCEYAVWAPDGQSVIYRASRGGTVGIYRQSAAGDGDAELLVETPTGGAIPTSVSRDGFLAFMEVMPAGPRGGAPDGEAGLTGRNAIRTLRLDDPGSVSTFLEGLTAPPMAAFSPDGKRLAYASDESGRMEVYVRPYPRAPGVGRLVSAGGGTGPVWAPDGTALYYRGASGELMRVPIALGPGFTAGRPQPLFRFDDGFLMSGTATAYDIHPGGERFIMVSNQPADAVVRARQVNVVQNWTDELTRLVPTD